ncbi:riboflavin synthase [Bacteroidetes bacterium endosymbiont of Geopemphigus sp.]|uniref:riboflavin synthase n=1 Tax=Bacteroidetes bacterium endosymbiont of Geopemphigus sp. TaxID=2047937 RepID=UPI000CD272CE|nr:riboflavin synthase [Bacteroidetes bacterium endosymbiont of Geopemphigus sp.]
MYTGIIEKMARLSRLKTSGSNLELLIENPFDKALKPDQSISHNGLCLTVVESDEQYYSVIATEETLRRSQLCELQIGDKINLERCLRVSDRLDGHIVQGHVDTTGYVDSVEDRNGSWIFYFSHEKSLLNITVEKGSITVNGISLTVVNSQESRFSVSVIPYTYMHTNLQFLKVGKRINIEFDIIGKYVARLGKYDFGKPKLMKHSFTY